MKLSVIKKIMPKFPDLDKPIQTGLRKGMKDVLTTSKRDYLSGGAGKLKMRTGDLKRGMKQKVFKKSKEHIGSLIAGKWYGGFHEYGNVNLMKRPFMKPALEDNEKEIKDYIQEEIQKYWNKK